MQICTRVCEELNRDNSTLFRKCSHIHNIPNNMITSNFSKWKCELASNNELLKIRWRNIWTLLKLKCKFIVRFGCRKTCVKRSMGGSPIHGRRRPLLSFLIYQFWLKSTGSLITIRRTAAEVYRFWFERLCQHPLKTLRFAKMSQNSPFQLAIELRFPSTQDEDVPPNSWRVYNFKKNLPKLRLCRSKWPITSHGWFRKIKNLNLSRANSGDTYAP